MFMSWRIYQSTLVNGLRPSGYVESHELIRLRYRLNVYHVYLMSVDRNRIAFALSRIHDSSAIANN